MYLMLVLPVTTVPFMTADVSNGYCYYDFKITIVPDSLMLVSIVKKSLVTTLSFCSSVQLVSRTLNSSLKIRCLRFFGYKKSSL
jgi:hypothetical protein